jgi:hypothetical protein
MKATDYGKSNLAGRLDERRTYAFASRRLGLEKPWVIPRVLDTSHFRCELSSVKVPQLVSLEQWLLDDWHRLRILVHLAFAHGPGQGGISEVTCYK